jgi:hypothetical protein
MRHLGLVLLLGLIGCLVDVDENMWKNRHDATRDALASILNAAPVLCSSVKSSTGSTSTRS